MDYVITRFQAGRWKAPDLGTLNHERRGEERADAAAVLVGILNQNGMNGPRRCLRSIGETCSNSFPFSITQGEGVLRTGTGHWS